MPPGQHQPGILLPALPNTQPLPEVVLFGFDALAFPFTRNCARQLIAGQQPRLVLRHGEEGAHDEGLLFGGTVVRIGDTFHLWYIGNYGPQANELTGERTNCCLCYACSPDGIAWEKPPLGLVEFNGSRQNNIVDLPVPALGSGAVVLFDPQDADPQRRFKLAYQTRLGGEARLCVAFSPDGLRWQPSPRNPVGPPLEVTGALHYRALYYVCGQPSGRSAGRLVTLASADFEDWSPCGACGLERRGEGEEVHLGAGLWNRGNVILAVYGQWHGHPTGDRRLASVDLGLALSHDALQYHEPVPDFRLVPAREQPHSPAGQMPALRSGQSLQNHREQTLCWYALWRASRGNGVRVVSWPRDRLGRLQPAQPWEAQAISTALEIVSGRARVWLNVSGLGEYTRLRVSLLDDGFRPLPRYSGRDAAVITEDGLRVPVHWDGGDLLSPSHGLLRLALQFEGIRPEDGRVHAVYVSA